MSDRSRRRDWRADHIPFHLITGMLGAGKTTLLRNLIRQRPAGERWAVLVNEFGDAGFDGDWLRNSGVPVREVQGGCMGCTAAVTLRVELNRLLREAQPDRLLIEPTGLGHPAELLRLLGGEHFQGVLTPAAHLCLIDPRRLREPRFAASPLWPAQLDAADLVVGSKQDLWDTQAASDFEDLRQRWPGARYTRCGPDGLDSAWLGLVPVERSLRPAHDHDHSHAGLEDWQAFSLRPPAGWFIDETALRALLGQWDWERIKGTLAGPQGGWRLDGVAGEIGMTALAVVTENRLQVIAPAEMDADGFRRALLDAGRR